MWNYLIFTSSGWGDPLHHSIQRVMNTWPVGVGAPQCVHHPNLNRWPLDWWHGNMLAGATGLQPHSPKDEVLLWDQQISPHDENRKELNSSGSLLKVTFCCTQHLQIGKEGVCLSTCKKKTGNIKLHCKSILFFQRISHLEAIYSPHKEAPVSWYHLHILWVLQQKYFSLFLSVLCTNNYTVGLLKPLSFIKFFYSIHLCLLIYAIYNFLLSLSRRIN